WISHEDISLRRIVLYGAVIDDRRDSSVLYRGMDRTALDAAYNNGAAVPDAPRYRADWASRSAAMRERHAKTLDIPYGTAPRAKLDLFLIGRREVPTLAFIHGGYWQMNAKENFAFIAEGPLAHGINVASIGYTLAPEAGMDQIVGEIRAAVDWLAKNLAAHGADPERLYVSGWSAGGHLTATVMDDPRVKGGIAVSGVFDLEPIRRSYLNEKLGLDAETARRNSPLFHLPERAGRLIVTVGGAELPELQRQSAEYFAAWTAHGLVADFVALPGCNHFSAIEEMARPEGRLVAALRQLIADTGG
ncbi:MAG TPA: alpha/beta hydrolase, partial [Stellaceae bacterium]|nr:alpha/beta hydrolase [Stellaceae bacterium]